MRAVLLTLLLLLSVVVSASVGEDFTFASMDPNVSIVHDESSRTIIASAGGGIFKIAYGSSIDTTSIIMTSVVPVSKGHVIHVDVQGHLDAHNHLFENHVVVHRLDGAIEYLDTDDDGLLGVNASLAHRSRLEPETLTEKVVAWVDYSTLDWSAEVQSDALDDTHVVTTVRLTSVDVPLRDANGSLIKRLPLIEYRYIWTTTMTADGEVSLPVYRLEVDDASQVVNAWQENHVNTPSHRITTQWQYDLILEGWNPTTSEGANRLHVSAQTIHAVETDKTAAAWMNHHGVTTQSPMQPVALLLLDEQEVPSTSRSGSHRSFECTAPTQQRGCLGPDQMLNEILTPMKLQGSRIRYSPSATEMNIFSDLHWVANVTADGVEYDVLSQVDDGRSANSDDFDPLIIESVNGRVFRTGLNYPLGEYIHHGSEITAEGIQYAAYTVDVAASNSVGLASIAVGPLMGVVFFAFVLLSVTLLARTSPASMSSSSPSSSNTAILPSPRSSNHDAEE